MKDIEELLVLQKNPYYKFTPEEQDLLDDFLSGKQDEKTQAKNSSKSSDKNTPATVKANNVVDKHDPSVPTDSNGKDLEDAKTAKQAKELGERPATVDVTNP